MSEELKKLVLDAKNICLIPSKNEPESLSSCLALFYTLRELGKNVNLISEKIPERLSFLIPSLDFLSSPKNFVISIPRSSTDISQIYYEKTDESLKIHLTTNKGSIRKEDISFYFQEAKPDLVITFGISDFKKYLENSLDSFAYLLGSPIINIDNNPSNLNFGQINIVENKSLSEIVLDKIKIFEGVNIDKNIANCLLAGLVLYYENFKNTTSPSVYQLASDLISKGANNQLVIDNLQKTTEKEMMFLSTLFLNIKNEGSLAYSIINSNEFSDISEQESLSLVQKLKTMGIQNNLLVLWESRNSDPITNGFFYSKNKANLNKVADEFNVNSKNEWVFIQDKAIDFHSTKERVLKLIL